MESFDIHADIQPSDTWLEEHHQVVQSETGDKGTYDVFAMVTEPVYPTVVDGVAVTGIKKLSIDFQINPVTIQLRGWYNTVTGFAVIKAFAKVPILPQVFLGEAQGNIKDADLKIMFGNKLISGWLRLYTLNCWLRVEFNLSILGKTVTKGDIQLIPIWFEAAAEAASASKA